jgi:flagellar motility protein MotE (MotC chaperone)
MTKSKKRAPFLRLLPGVMVMGFGLMVLNGSGLIRAAEAGIDQPADKDALAPPLPPQNDFAGDPAQSSSASEVDVLTNLAKRRSELDAREAKIQNEANILAATETRVDAKITQLKSLEARITALLVQRDAEQQKQVAALVKTYTAMKPTSAAVIFDNLSDDVLIPVAQAMKPDDLGQILAKMSPGAAEKLTLKLADKLALPATDDAAAPVPSPAVAPASAPAVAPASAPLAATPSSGAQAGPAKAAPPPGAAAPKSSG